MRVLVVSISTRTSPRYRGLFLALYNAFPYNATMTPLRFRAWHPNNKRMYDVRSLHNLHSGVNVHADLCRHADEDGKAVFSTHYEECDCQDQIVYMQSTGLHDKNGKEIFCSDIIQNNNGVKQEVKWGFGDSNCGCAETGYGWNITSDQIKRWEYKIIGNIYQNPNLL